MIWNFLIFLQVFLKSFTWNNFFCKLLKKCQFWHFHSKAFCDFGVGKSDFPKCPAIFEDLHKFSKIDIMKNLLFLEWVCVRVDLWHLKNCQKIGSVYFSNFQKIILFKRSVYRVRVSVGPCIFLIPLELSCIFYIDPARLQFFFE